MLLFHLLAQAAVAAAPAASAEAAPQQGVISYPASFFTAQFPANAQEMITRVPGFTLDSGASVRGYEGAAGNVLIDGKRPSTKTDSLDEILRRIAANQVERIEVIRGGAPGIDMQGKAVIANVVRKKSGGVHGVAALAFVYTAIDDRVKPQLRLEGSGDQNGRHWEASVRGAGYVDDGSGNGPMAIDDRAGQPLQRAQISSRGLGVQKILAGVYELPAFGGTLRANARLFWDDFHFQETDDVSYPSHFYQHDDSKQDRFDTEVGGRYSREFGAQDSLEIVALRQSEQKDFSERFDTPGDQTLFTARNDTAESIVRGVFKHRYDEHLSSEGGIEGALNTLDAHQSFSENGQAVALPAANVHVEEKRWEAFAKGVWQVARPLTLEAVLRQEGSTISSSGDVQLEKSLYFTKPRLALTWDVDSKTQVRLRFERVVGQLNFNDFVASSSLNTGVITAGNPDLNPEQDWVSEAAVERRFLGDGVASFSYRHSEITDAQDRAPGFSSGGVFDAPANIGSGTKDEYIVQATLPLDRFGVKAGQLRGVGTWRNSEVTDPTTHQKREISGLRPVEWEAHFSQDVTAWRLTWGTDVYGQWRERYYRFNAIETRKLGTWVQLFTEWKPKPNTSIRVELDNAIARGFKNALTNYDGPRGAAPVASVQIRSPHYGREIFFRVRRTFG